ncbi:hypothetical protein [Chitinophaga caseinilytica]|uniref:hypothetical protein n=1 Tax=Chitinophaga caseinilytica TaxID=2267521 RepID=UPI003C2B8795
MWSNFYWYFNLRSDAHFSSMVRTEQIITLLGGNDHLIRDGARSFIEKPGMPSIRLTCIYTKDGNFGTPASLENEWCTLIEIQADKTRPENLHYFKSILTGIARELSWELVLEADDNENEDILLYTPKT